MDYSIKQLAQTLQNYLRHKREKNEEVLDEETKTTLSRALEPLVWLTVQLSENYVPLYTYCLYYI